MMFNSLSTKIFLLIFAIVLQNGCNIQDSDKENEKIVNEHFVLATLYAQISAECKALQIQAFNVAKKNIIDYINKNSMTGAEAIVIDIDETILETSSYQTMMISKNKSWPYKWKEFLESAQCKPIPGSQDFLHLVDSLGIKIYYVSNRKEDQRESLKINLLSLNYPQINDKNILLKQNNSSKEERRSLIRKNNKILLYVGDSVNDFSEIFETKSLNDRNNAVLNNSKYFGDKFIMLPNPTYGEWEDLIYNYNWDLNLEERDSLRKKIIDSLYHSNKEF